MIEFIARQINQQPLLGIIFGIVIGFIFAKVTGKLFKWLFILGAIFVIGYLYYKGG